MAQCTNVEITSLAYVDMLDEGHYSYTLRCSQLLLTLPALHYITVLTFQVLYIILQSIITHVTAVRYGRVPKRSQSCEDQLPMSTTIEPLDQLQMESEEEMVAMETRRLAIYDVILTISQSHSAFCDVTEDKVKTLTPKHVTLVRSASND